MTGPNTNVQTAPGTCYVVSAPSGAGKTSLVNALVEDLDQLHLSVSHTTRKPRPGEIEGEHYHFVTSERFNSMVRSNEFAEYAQVFDNAYGTAKAPVQASLERGEDVILEIDWQGARQIRNSLPGVVSIFILPPSLEELRRRLSGRQQDSEATIDARMAKAVAEMSHHDEYDYLVVNDEFSTAREELTAILTSQRLTADRQRKRHGEMIKGLLG